MERFIISLSPIVGKEEQGRVYSMSHEQIKEWFSENKNKLREYVYQNSEVKKIEHDEIIFTRNSEGDVFYRGRIAQALSKDI